MAKSPRKSPSVGKNPVGPGHNSGLPAHDAIRRCLAIDILFDEQKAALNERHKRARSGFERFGVTVDGVKQLKLKKDDAASEIESWLRGAWHYLGAVFAPLHEQFDLLAPKQAAPERRAAFFTQGLLAGMQGKPLVVPPALGGDELQQITDGWNEGAKQRKDAEAEILAMALDPKNDGKVTDGTPAAVNARAAKDFAADNGDDPLVVNGERYPSIRSANAARKRIVDQRGAAPAAPQSEATPAATPPESQAAPVAEGEQGQGETLKSPASSDASPAPEPAAPTQVPPPKFEKWDDDPENWFAADRAAFRRWFESMPADHVPAITHKGAVAYWRFLVQEREATKAPPEESFAEATEEELAAQKGRKQTADLPDEEAVAQAARDLQASEFTKGARKVGDSLKRGRNKP